MDGIQKIVADIIEACDRRGVTVKEPLTAFVAKAVILENADLFQLDRVMTPEDVKTLVQVRFSLA
jgi:hypothetical protein